MGARYFWRVRACDADGCSAWTPVRYVDVGRMMKDFNGDGYADAIVGALGQDACATNEGNVFVYYGGPSGLADTPSVTLDNPGRKKHEAPIFTSGSPA